MSNVLSWFQMELDLHHKMPLWRLEQRIEVLEAEQVALISVPVPEFGLGDPADIVHDFQRVRRILEKNKTRLLHKYRLDYLR